MELDADIIDVVRTYTRTRARESYVRMHETSAGGVVVEFFKDVSMHRTAIASLVGELPWLEVKLSAPRDDQVAAYWNEDRCEAVLKCFDDAKMTEDYTSISFGWSVSGFTIFIGVRDSLHVNARTFEACADGNHIIIDDDPTDLVPTALDL